MMRRILAYAILAVVSAIGITFFSSSFLPYLLLNYPMSWLIFAGTIAFVLFCVSFGAYKLYNSKVAHAHKRNSDELDLEQIALRLHTVTELGDVTTTLPPQQAEDALIQFALSRLMFTDPEEFKFIRIKIYLERRSSPLMFLDVSEEETIGTLRSRIAEIIDLPTTNIRLKLEGREPMNLSTKVKDLHLKKDEGLVLSIVRGKS